MGHFFVEDYQSASRLDIGLYGENSLDKGHYLLVGRCLLDLCFLKGSLPALLFELWGFIKVMVGLSLFFGEVMDLRPVIIPRIELSLLELAPQLWVLWAGQG